MLLGVIQAQAAGQVAGSFELLETQVLASSAASVTFSGLSAYAADYQHLQVRMTARFTSAFTERTVDMRINGDTGNNYAWHALFPVGSSVVSGAANTTDRIFLASTPAASATANAYAGVVIDYLDAFSITKNKTIRAFGGNTTTPQIRLASGLYLNTASITSISFQEIFSGSSFASGSRFSLYGIKAGA